MVTLGTMLRVIDSDETVDVRARDGEQVYLGSVRQLEEISGPSLRDMDVLRIGTAPNADLGRVLTVMLARR